MDRRSLERWSVAFGGAAVCGTFCFYVSVWVIPRYYSGELDRWVRAIVDGTSEAPYQYRVLVPAILVWLTDHAGLTMAQATIVVDGSALAVGSALGFRLVRRSGLALYSLPVGLYAAFLGTGLLYFAKPETMVSFAALTLALSVLMDDSRQAGQWWLLGSVAAVLALCRTDLLVALACGFGVRWVQRRVRADGFATGGLVLAAVAATAILVHRYPHARYPPGVPAVQLGYNVEPLPLVTAASFLLPALGPLLFARASRLRPVVVSVLQRCSPLVGVIAGELVLAAVLGEIDEVRLLFPLAFPLAVVGIELWRAVVPAIVTAGAPVRWATDDAAPSRRNDP